MTRTFDLIDVFGETPFTGNPLAVVHSAEGLSTEQMQQITRWLNLSETVFLLPPTVDGADYQARIFTLDRELPFAGHPTLGACHAWLAAGGIAADGKPVVQQCGAGLVPVICNEELLFFAGPPLIRSGAVDAAELRRAARVLNIEESDIVASAWVDNGPGWLGIMLESADKVLALEPARYCPDRVEIGVVARHLDQAVPTFEVRAFFSDHHRSIVEDPVTGSLNASIGQWLFDRGEAKGFYRAIQGTRVGRRGRIMVEERDGRVWVGGRTRTVVHGELN